MFASTKQETSSGGAAFSKQEFDAAVRRAKKDGYFKEKQPTEIALSADVDEGYSKNNEKGMNEEKPTEPTEPSNIVNGKQYHKVSGNLGPSM